MCSDAGTGLADGRLPAPTLCGSSVDPSGQGDQHQQGHDARKTDRYAQYHLAECHGKAHADAQKERAQYTDGCRAEGLRIELDRGLSLHLPPDDRGDQQDGQTNDAADDALIEHPPLRQHRHAHAQSEEHDADGA